MYAASKGRGVIFLSMGGSCIIQSLSKPLWYSVGGMGGREGGGGQIFFVITEIIYFYFLILYFQIFWFQSRSKTSSQPTNHYAVGIVNIMYIYSIIHSYICNLKIYNPLYMYKCYLSIRLKRKTNVTIKNKYSHISFNIC